MQKVAEPLRRSDTETAILEAARDLLADGGMDALSMRAVAARVGVSATAIYNYFENKRALVERVISMGFERFDGYLREAVVDRPKGSAERLRSLGEAYIRFALENRAYFRVLFSIDQAGGPGSRGAVLVDARPWARDAAAGLQAGGALPSLGRGSQCPRLVRALRRFRALRLASARGSRQRNGFRRDFVGPNSEPPSPKAMSSIEGEPKCLR